MKRIRTGRSIILGVYWMNILLASVFWHSITAYAGLGDGLIANYPFNGNPMDVGSNEYNGIANNGVLLTDDRFGKPDRAYSFDGKDDYIAAGNFELPSVFSLSLWINPQTIKDGQMFLGKQSAGTDPLFVVGFFKDGYGVGIGTVFYADGEKTTGWQHLAVVVEKTGTQYHRVLLYKNSRLLWSKNHFNPVEDAGALPITIGAAWDGASPVSFFSGEMDDVRIYDRALSQTEIELLYNPIQGLDITSDDDIDGEDLSFFSESIGKIRWYRDRDGDGYSDGSSRWSQDRPDNQYYSKAELKGISGDCDDLNLAVNPDATGTQCPPFGGCCYTVEENCSPVVRCDDNVSELICITELNGTFHKSTQCSDLSPDECPVDNGLGACCQTMLSSDGSTSYAICNNDVTTSECADKGGSFFANRQCSELTPEECPVSTPTGACCHPKISYVNESGVFPVQCLDSLTEYKCKLLQGSWSEAQKCKDLSESECPPFGACCYDDSTTGTKKCANWMLESNCNKLSGTFSANRKCDELTEEECPVIHPSLGACCLTATNTDGSVLPVRCVDSRTQTQCNAMGGSWYEEQTCASLTFEQCPAISVPTGACCQTMVSGDGSTSAVCNDNMSNSECADAGGSFFSGRQCSDLTSEECPVPTPTGSCCHPKISYVNESGVFPVQCLDSLTEYKCKLLQGSWSEAQKCKDLSESECPPFGACCYDDSTTGTKKCANWMLESNCNKLSGTFSANRKCDELTEEECPVIHPSLGACCLTATNTDGSVLPVRCVDSRTQTQCNAMGGSWYEEQTCASLTFEQCPAISVPAGACCQTMVSGDGSTSAVCNDNMSNSECADAGGSFFSGRQCSDLTSEECPVPTPTGSCCHPKISYVNESGVFPVQCLDSLTEYKCKLLQGTWSKNQSCADLSETECPPFGACCYDDSTTGTKKCANWMLESNCNKLSGTFSANRKCDELTEEECPVIHPSLGACCLTATNTDGSVVPVRCVDSRTQTQCNAMGGSWYEEQTCASLTFEQCPAISVPTGACCQTMVSGDGSTSAVCNDNVSNSECADAGGSFFSGRQCSDLTSEECPVPTPTGSCCHPKISYVNESGVFPVQCLDSLTEYKCKLLQGTWSKNQSCADLSETECPPFGACCYDDSTGTKKCANWMLESNCNKLSGTFSANRKCDELTEEECPVIHPSLGACCLTATNTDGSVLPVRCVDSRTQTQCNAMGGSWYEEQTCASLTFEQCPAISVPTGACCQTMVSGDGSTSAVCNDNVSNSECADAGGSFFSGRQCSDLTSEECPVPTPTGSCCHPKISYVNESGVFPVQCLDSLTEYKCKILQGTWSEAQKCANLSESECPPFGACCYEDADGTAKCANWMLESNCKKLSGTFFVDQKCSELTAEQCPIVTPSVGACCLSENASSPIRCIDARTQAQCKAVGGNWYEKQACSELTDTQCPPLPETTGACCQTTVLKDGSTTAVCNDNVTDTKCADSGGSFFADRQCSDLTLEECPVPAPTGACCHPKISYVNESGVFPVQCLNSLTEYKCNLLQGSWYEDQACEDLTETQCAPFGACCYEEDGVAKCNNWMLERNCKKLEGKFYADLQCSDLTEKQCPVSPPSVGACCLPTISKDFSILPAGCMDLRTQDQCTSMGGTWFEEQACSGLTDKQCPPLAM